MKAEQSREEWFEDPAAMETKTKANDSEEEKQLAARECRENELQTQIIKWSATPETKVMKSSDIAPKH